MDLDFISAVNNVMVSKNQTVRTNNEAGALAFAFWHTIFKTIRSGEGERESETDVAVIKIDGKDLPCVKLGNSKDVKEGEWVAAIGAPFGLENTVTSGIVSAKSRNLPSDQFVPSY